MKARETHDCHYFKAGRLRKLWTQRTVFSLTITPSNTSDPRSLRSERRVDHDAYSLNAAPSPTTLSTLDTVTITQMPTRSIAISLLTTTLRVHDSPLLYVPLNSAQVTHLLPLFVFDERQIELGGMEGQGYHKLEKGKEARTRVARFWR